VKVLLLLVALLGGVSGAASSLPAEGIEQDEVLAAIRGRLAATERNDVDGWARYVDDSMLAPLEGAVPSKQAWLGMHRSWPAEVHYWYGEIEQPKVRIHGDTAVTVYSARQFTKIGDQTTSVRKWQIETHLRRNGRWLLIGVADGLIPPEPVAVAVDTAILDSYVGDYEWAPKLISQIRRKGDGLTDELTGQGISELAAENDTTFFIKGEAAGGDSSRVIFVKENGRVTHYIYREMGATDRIVRKIR